MIELRPNDETTLLSHVYHEKPVLLVFFRSGAWRWRGHPTYLQRMRRMRAGCVVNLWFFIFTTGTGPRDGWHTTVPAECTPHTCVLVPVWTVCRTNLDIDLYDHRSGDCWLVVPPHARVPRRAAHACLAWAVAVGWHSYCTVPAREDWGTDNSGAIIF